MTSYIFFTGCCIVLISSFAYSQNKPDKKQIEKGKTLSRYCVNCHGTTKAAGSNPLQKIRQVRTADYIYKLVQNPARFVQENEEAKKIFTGKPLMPAFANLSKTDIDAILDYLDSLPYDSKNYKFRKTN